VSWLPAQRHHGENIGDTPTHVLYVELKEAAEDGERRAAEASGQIGPDSS
jgi:hypothetical protein